MGWQTNLICFGSQATYSEVRLSASLDLTPVVTRIVSLTLFHAPSLLGS